MRLPLVALLAPAIAAPILITGCAGIPAATTLPTGAAALGGSVHGGQQPVVGAVVTLWAAGATGYGSGATVLATAAPTDAKGMYQFGAITCPTPATPTYVTAQGGNAGYTTNTSIMLATGLGPCSGLATLNANINEVTTAATAFALSHFFTGTLGPTSTDAFGGAATPAEGMNAGLVLANAATIPALVSLGTGDANQSTARVTLESAKLNTIANVLAACVNSGGATSTTETTTVCGQLFSLTTPPGAATRPSDTLQAAVQMALYPYQNVAGLAALPPAASPFIGLGSTPNDWTLAIGYTAPGLGLGIAGTSGSGTSANLDIDSTGRVWFATNTAAAHGLAYFDPASGSFSGPYATALVAPQYLAIDTHGVVWGTDLAGNRIVGVSSTNPSAATVYTTLPGTTTGPIAVTSSSTVPDALLYSVTAGVASAVWLEDGGALLLVNATTQQPTGLAPYTYQSPGDYFEGDVASSQVASPCALEVSYVDQGVGYLIVPVQSAGPCISGGIAQFQQTTGESLMAASTLNEVCSYIAQTCFAPTVPLSLPEGIAVDGDSNVWIANAGNASVSTAFYNRVTSTTADYVTTSPVAYLHGAGQGSTLTAPYGLAIDRSGNVWIANAGCVTTSATPCTPGPFRLSELVGAAAPTITPLALQTTAVANGTRPALMHAGSAMASGRQRARR